jgi:hypothetical protein
VEAGVDEEAETEGRTEVETSTSPMTPDKSCSDTFRLRPDDDGLRSLRERRRTEPKSREGVKGCCCLLGVDVA